PTCPTTRARPGRSPVRRSSSSRPRGSRRSRSSGSPPRPAPGRCSAGPERRAGRRIGRRLPTSAPSSVAPTHRLPAPAAVLWDMDGTIVDSEPYWIATETALAAEHGGTWTHEQGLAMVGRPITDTARLLRELGVPGTVDEIAGELVTRVTDLIRTEGAPWRPGARELLEAVGQAGIPSALVTMSYREMADAVLAALPAGTFAAVVTGDE